MKLFTADTIRKMEEEACIENKEDMYAMMKSAGEKVANCVNNRSGTGKIVILCGKGNNAGDGFIAAEKLCATHDVKVILLSGQPELGISHRAFSSMPDDIEVVNYSSNIEKDIFELIDTADVIIDAVFGFGFKGVLPDEMVKVFLCANEAKAYRVSADMPSGAVCDTAELSRGSFKADATVTFNTFKPAIVSYPAKANCGEVILENVGISSEIINKTHTDFMLIDGNEVKRILPKIRTESNKGSNGKLVMICGSYGMAGACIMAAKAALRSGLGLLSIIIDERIYPIVASAVPEAVFKVLQFRQETLEDDFRVINEEMKKATACLLGCGLGELKDKLCEYVLGIADVPVLLDADALNFVASKGCFECIKGKDVLMTPHPGEMSRLMQTDIDTIQSHRIDTARMLSEKTGAVVLLKGAATVISDGGKVAVNSTGNPGMAKGGSGDVLSGVIAALLAQGISLYDAAVAGAFIHGLAGDFCADEFSQRSMLPTDIINMLPEVYKYSSQV